MRKFHDTVQSASPRCPQFGRPHGEQPQTSHLSGMISATGRPEAEWEMIKQALVFEPREGAGAINWFLPKRNPDIVENVGGKA